MAKGILLPIPRLGITPAASSKLWCWAPGGTTKQTVYSDSDLTTPVTQPLSADSAGLFSAVYLDPAYGYKIAVYASSEVNDPPTGTPLYSQDNAYLPAAHVDALVCQGRLTLESAVPVSTTDQSAKTTIYFTPYGGSAIALYDTTAAAWRIHTFSEVSLSLAGLAADTNYDLFLYDTAGTKTLEQVAWSSGTARATALATQNGVYVKTGSANKRYVGTFRTTATIGQCEDSVTKRFAWSYYHRARRGLKRVESTASWTYTTTTWRQANGATANKVEVVVGVAEVLADIRVDVASANNTANIARFAGIGADTVTANSADVTMPVYNSIPANQVAPMSAMLRAMPAVGYHYYAMVEESSNTGITTWYGNNGDGTLYQSGLLGSIEG